MALLKEFANQATFVTSSRWPSQCTLKTYSLTNKNLAPSPGTTNTMGIVLGMVYEECRLTLICRNNKTVKLTRRWPDKIIPKILSR